MTPGGTRRLPVACEGHSQRPSGEMPQLFGVLDGVFGARLSERRGWGVAEPPSFFNRQRALTRLSLFVVEA